MTLNVEPTGGPHVPVSPPGKGDHIVCSCLNVSLREIQDVINGHPDISFDKFLELTSAGSKCTACLLDLECHYIEHPRDLKHTEKHISKPTAVDTPLSLKQQIYRVIDGMSPNWPWVLPNIFPVIEGDGVDQWLWVANHSLLYEESVVPPAFRIDLTLRNSIGTITWRDTWMLGAGEERRENLSQRLRQSTARDSASQTELRIGSLNIVRRAQGPGFRGTTRPQIQILTAKSSCGVHGQAAGPRKGGSFTCLYRPSADRIFVSAVNVSKRKLELDFIYPLDPLDPIEQSNHGSVVAQVDLPPHGARLHEVLLPQDMADSLLDQLFKFAWLGEGTYKTHVIVASPTLDRFSIDHA